MASIIHGTPREPCKHRCRSKTTCKHDCCKIVATVDDEDEFGLSSGDEAELLKIELITPPASSKRQLEDDGVEASQSKMVKREAQDDESGNIEELNIKIKLEHQSDGAVDPDKTAIKRDDDEKTWYPVISTPPVPTTAVDIAKKVLIERFNIPSFRLQQQEAIVRLLLGESAVVVFSTGGGKSLCYQVPALCFKEMDKLSGIRQGPSESGITLVVSPLIALMKDQVDALHRKGISAAVLDSTKTREQNLLTETSMRAGTLDILYCAPEKLNNESFVSSMAHVKGGIRLLAVDEAHCISEWGHAFRPDYLKVARFAKEIQAERVVCLTATATPLVAKSVCKAFDISEAGLFKTSTFRRNLKLQAMSFQTKAESYPVLEVLLAAHPGSTIVYVTTREQSEQLALRLQKRKFEAHAFHAGMRPDDKAKVQEDFMSSDELIIVATIAFGMCIDKSNIRNVIHYDIPRSLEGYSQEIGRAGRDHLESHCVLFICGEDLHLRESFARSELTGRTSVLGLLQHVFSIGASDGPHPTIEASSYVLSKRFDITETTLGNIYAQLELRFGLLRATTPKYNRYHWKQSQPTTWDQTPAALAIRSSAETKNGLTEIDIELAVKKSGISRNDIMRTLKQWHHDRHIDLEYSGATNVFRVGKNWPPSPGQAIEILDALYKDLELREQQALARMQQVIDLVSGHTCFAYALSAHFGDTLPNGARECKSCTWCETKNPVAKVAAPEKPWNSTAFFRVLETVKARDDARYLARIAFGISSPRVRAERLSSSPVFKSMQDHNFMALLNAFQKVCDKEAARLAAGLTPGEYAPTPPRASGVSQPAKRALSRSTSTGSYTPKPNPAAKRSFGRSFSSNSTGNPYRPGSGAWHQYRRGNPKWT